MFKKHVRICRVNNIILILIDFWPLELLMYTNGTMKLRIDIIPFLDCFK